MTDRHPTDDPELDAVPADAEDEEEAGLYEHFAVTADKGQTPMRLDKFLTVRMEHCSRNRIQAAADSGNILVNGKAAKSSYKVKPLDRIQIVMPYPRREVELVAEDIPLDIPYEDQWLLLVDKPAGLVVHPGVGNYSGTLVNALMHHLNKQGIPAEEQNRAGLVHRIDKNTSGLLVIAKDEQTHARHLDPLWSLLRGVCLTVYCFDPLVWLAAVLSREDCELACDDLALRRLDDGARIAYGRTLLDQISIKRAPMQAALCATTMVSGKKTLRARIRLIAKKPKIYCWTK